ncbi:transglycosylase domain-containing protein [Oryzobacter telluris]|uniref:transglycosylase domain-containing protein n=1 Tax=Oryzobacter telluris TaxID=3149179 RepID=UPI00370D7770
MDGRAHNVSAVLRLLLGFVVLSTVAGLLMAGLAIPAIGATGQAAKGGVNFFNDLPSDFTVSPLAQQSRILDADGKLIANPYDENRIIVPLKKISKTMQNAQIAIEDSRFYEHGGLDVRGFSRAMLSNLQGGDVQGASTLTQQYVKITLQENALRKGDKEAAAAAVQKSYSRKLQELKYALNVEENFTKDQILEGYLNLVYYGDQAYGVEAAALNYFGVSASKLTLAQAALMAGVVQQPTAYNPVINPKAAQTRRNIVLDRMQALGLASAKDVAAAKKLDVKKMIHKKPAKGVCHRSTQPYFCTYVLEWLQKSPQMAVLGKTPADRIKAINQGGLTIRTTLKPAMQKAAQREITKAVPVNNKQNLGAGATIIEPGTGKVLAMAQATDFGRYQTNVNVDQVYGGGPLGYQFGSTAKTFGVVAALEKGMPLEGTIKVPFATGKKGYEFKQESLFKSKCGASRPFWSVKNDYPSGGKMMTLGEGISKSINTWAAQLVIDVGPCDVRDVMTKMGLHKGDGKPIDPHASDITLGSGTTNMMSLANAYATLAASGKYCEPNPVTSITTSDKKEVKVPGPQCKQVISQDVADGVTYLLKGTLDSGTAKGVWSNAIRPAAGKTGTTEGHNQGWFVGYTKQLATAVWLGNLRPASKNGKMYSLNGKCFGEYGCISQVFGGTVSAPVWAKIMRAASEGLPVKDFPAPSAAIRAGSLDGLPNVIGRSASKAASLLAEAGFKSHVEGKINSSLPAGTVAATTPAGSALKGSDVGLLISTGVAYYQPDPQPQQQQPTPPGKQEKPPKPGKP